MYTCTVHVQHVHVQCTCTCVHLLCICTCTLQITCSNHHSGQLFPLRLADCLDCFPLSYLESSHVMCVYMYKCLSPSCEHTCSRGPCMYMCSISSFLSVLLLGLLHIIQIYMYLDKMTSSSCLSCLYACTTCCHFSVHIHCKWMCGCGNIFSAYCIYNVHGYDNFTTQSNWD